MIKKVSTYSETYATSIKSKPQCLKKIKLSKCYAELNDAIKFGINQRFWTIQNLHILLIFCNFLEKKNLTLNEIDEETILDFLFINSVGKSQSTSHMHKNTILAFVNYHTKIINSKTLNIKSYKYNQDKKLYKYTVLSKSEISEIYENLKIYPYSKDRIQDTFIFDILLKTGIRVTELIHIKKYDLTFMFEYCYISIMGKNNLSRVVAISIQPHKEKIKYVMNLKGVWLFTNKGNQITREYIYRLISGLLKFSNISKNKSGPHLLRHTYASQLYEKEKDLILVQEVLGHTNITTTMRYIHLNIDSLKKAASAFDDFDDITNK